MNQRKRSGNAEKNKLYVHIPFYPATEFSLHLVGNGKLMKAKCYPFNNIQQIFIEPCVYEVRVLRVYSRAVRMVKGK